MNVGVAITYQDISTNFNPYSAATKNMMPGATEGQQNYYGATARFRYGNAAPYVTGEPETTNDINGKPTYCAHMSQRSKRGVLIDLYMDRTQGNNIWNALSRSIMYVPFNKFYLADTNGNISKTEQLDDFRSYISGFESYGVKKSIDSGDFLGPADKPVKDEFWASSLTLLSTAIYGGRESSEGRFFPYHKGKTVSESGSNADPTDEPMIQYAVEERTNAGSTNSCVIYLDPSKNSEGLRTGQAVGSVIDFFSPPTTSESNNGLDGVRFVGGTSGDATAGFFPVQGSCQSNWLIVFCSGMDAVPDYPPSEAVSRLFQKTRKMRGREKDMGGNWIEASFDMDSGIRTLVVGFLPEERSDEPIEIRNVRNDLKEMAMEGDPILTPSGYIKNVEAKPEFAKNVPELVRAFNTVMKRICVEKMGSGTYSLPPVIDNITDPETRMVFGAVYRINPLDQWNGWLGKYKLVNNQNSIEWEANEVMISQDTQRALYTSTATINANYNAGSVVKVDAARLQNLAGIPNSHSELFSKWLINYGHNSITGDSVGALGDMVNSGITVVGKPKHKELISGSANNRNAVVYVQTNRGVLHALDYKTGYEIWGFIPPNIFQHRLVHLKFDVQGNAKEWVDGNGYTKPRSNPMVLLDGMVIARDVDVNNQVRTLLTGYLGNGGNGFYAMNITHMGPGSTTPVFEWAIENARYGETGTFSVANNIKRWGRATDTGDYNYTDLGLTIVPGVYFTPVGRANTVGVLPGGLGHKVGVNDSQGKAFYFFNPINGSIEGLIDSDVNAAGFVPPENELPKRKLGMGISPIIYHENSAKKAIAFYTSDSEGNIIKCDTTDANVKNWKLRSIFQLRTIGPRKPYDGIAASPAPRDLPIAIPRKLLLGRARTGQLWLFGGTSDLYAPLSEIDSSRKIVNREQYIFGINTKKILDNVADMNSGINPEKAVFERFSNGEPKMRFMPYFIDNIPQKYGYYGEPYSYNKSVMGVEHGMDDYGWVLRLRPRFGSTEAEYLSADPFLMNNVLYFATFVPYVGTRYDEVCSDIGAAKLYAIDPSTGLSVMPDRSAVVLENIKIAGMTGNPATHRLVLSVKELRVDSKKEIFNPDNFDDAVEIGSSLFEIGALGGEKFDPDKGEPELDFEELIPHIQYWRERF
jgi:hypothetical protein